MIVEDLLATSPQQLVGELETVRAREKEVTARIEIIELVLKVQGHEVPADPHSKRKARK